MKVSGKGLLISAMPGLMVLGLFYGLAMHMYLSLGGWPNSIGERGFPWTLVVHSRVTWKLCQLFLLTAVFAAQIALIVCLFERRWRIGAPYFIAYLVCSWACWGLMMLAPGSFLNWWWD